MTTSIHLVYNNTLGVAAQNFAEVKTTMPYKMSTLNCSVTIYDLQRHGMLLSRLPEWNIENIIQVNISNWLSLYEYLNSTTKSSRLCRVDWPYLVKPLMDILGLVFINCWSTIRREALVEGNFFANQAKHCRWRNKIWQMLSKTHARYNWLTCTHIVPHTVQIHCSVEYYHCTRCTTKLIHEQQGGDQSRQNKQQRYVAKLGILKGRIYYEHMVPGH